MIKLYIDNGDNTHDLAGIIFDDYSISECIDYEDLGKDINLIKPSDNSRIYVRHFDQGECKGIITCRVFIDNGRLSIKVKKNELVKLIPDPLIFTNIIGTNFIFNEVLPNVFSPESKRK